MNILQSENYFKYLDTNTNISLIKKIQISYELQAGSYENIFKNEPTDLNKAMKQNALTLKTYILEIIKNNGKCNILEAGIGEGNILRYLLDIIDEETLNNINYYGFDLSISRLGIAKKYLNKINLFVCDLKNIPIQNDFFDIVYTHSAIEPNKGFEENIINELYKKTSNYLILFEPTYEEANEQCKKRFDNLGYIKNLKNIIITNNINLIDYELCYENDNYCQYKYIIKKEQKNTSGNKNFFLCPIFNIPLSCIKYNNINYYKTDNLCIHYPIVNDIPILLSESSIPINY